MNCSTCGKPMVRIKWGSMFDMMVCDNVGCVSYRNPGPPVPKAETIPEEEPPPSKETPAKGRPKGSKWKPKVIPPEEFMDEETTSPAIESLRRMREELSAKKENPEVL